MGKNYGRLLVEMLLLHTEKPEIIKTHFQACSKVSFLTYAKWLLTEFNSFSFNQILD